MEMINWMYLWDPEGMLKLLQLALLSAAIACAAEYQDSNSLSDMTDSESDRMVLFYVVFAIGLVVVFFLFISFLFNLNKKCGSAKGWTSFVMVFSFFWAVLCAVASGLFSEVLHDRQVDNWDDSSDDTIQWRYQHALAAVALGYASFLSFLVDSIVHYRLTFSSS